MPDARIEFTLGVLSFSGEGEQDWLATQLEKVLKAAPEMAALASVKPLGESRSQVGLTSTKRSSQKRSPATSVRKVGRRTKSSGSWRPPIGCDAAVQFLSRRRPLRRRYPTTNRSVFPTLRTA